MLLRTKLRKLQTGGSLNQSLITPMKIDFTWKNFDTSRNAMSPLKAPPQDDGFGSSKSMSGLGGLPSDLKYVQGELTAIKDKIKTKLSGPGAKEYGDSAEFKTDSDSVVTWTERLAMLKSREDNFKTTKTRLDKAKDDYAMFGGKAFVRNNETKDNEIVSIKDILMARTKTAQGFSPKYTPLTVGAALAARFEDPNFSGFREDTGGQLDYILSGAQDSSVVKKEMDDMFSRVGSISEATGKFVQSSTGQEFTVQGLLADLESAQRVYSSGTSKTNQANLQAATQLFQENMSPAHREALMSSAVASFIDRFGNQGTPQNEGAVAEWIEAKINSDIVSRALAFLKTSQGKGSGKTAEQNEADALSKKTIETNQINYARMGGVGEKVSIMTKLYDDAEDLKDKTNILMEADASSISINDAVEDAAKSVTTKNLGRSVGENGFIRQLTGEDLQNNLFLADDKSTPVASLNNGRGLKTSMVNPYAGKAYILRSIPYRIEDGRKKIAWTEVKKYSDWGKKFEELSKKRMEVLKKNRLSWEEREDIIEETNAAMKYSLHDDPSIKVGDIAMIPLVVKDTDRGIDDPDLDQVMQSDVSTQEEKLIEDIKGAVLDRQIKRTYAFTVLPNDPRYTLVDAYGPKMAIKEKINVKDYMDHLKQAQTITKEGFDMVDYVFSRAQNEPVDPTK